MLEAFAAWLGATPLNAFVAGEAWVIPAVQTVHILAIAVVFGAAAIVNLRIVGLVERRQSIASVIDRFRAPSIAAVVILAITGFILISGEPNRAIFRTVFWAKMALLTFAVLLSVALASRLESERSTVSASSRPPLVYRVAATATLLVWVAIIVAGRWIGYAEGWPGSPQ